MIQDTGSLSGDGHETLKLQTETTPRPSPIQNETRHFTPHQKQRGL